MRFFVKNGRHFLGFDYDTHQYIYVSDQYDTRVMHWGSDVMAQTYADQFGGECIGYRVI